MLSIKDFQKHSSYRSWPGNVDCIWFLFFFPCGAFNYHALSDHSGIPLAGWFWKYVVLHIPKLLYCWAAIDTLEEVSGAASMCSTPLCLQNYNYNSYYQDLLWISAQCRKIQYKQLIILLLPLRRIILGQINISEFKKKKKNMWLHGHRSSIECWLAL